MIAAALTAIAEQGYTILERLLDADAVAAMKDALAPLLRVETTPLGRNDFEGFATNRVYALLAKAPSIAELVEHPAVLPILDALLLPNFLLSANLAINLLPGETVQPWHIDDGFYPIPRPRPAIGVSTICTRRFFALFAAEVFGTSGSSSPRPAVRMRIGCTPWRSRYAFTASARRSESSWLCWRVPSESAWPMMSISVFG